MTKTLVISGGSAGIGLATARQFSDNGFRVLNLSRSTIDLPHAVQINTDLSDPEWPVRSGGMLNEALQDCSQIALVHCAGLLLADRANELAAEDLRRALEINVVAPSILNQLVLPHMKTGSSITYVGSTLGEKAVAGACSYVTSKHAMIGLMRATCQDLAGSGVHTTCVCPGFTDTEMLRKHVGGDEQVLRNIAAGVTFNRLIEPGEIAATIAFCAAHPVLNGAVIHANLGQIER